MSNKKEMKKAGIIWRILKWFGLTVLSALIILGLIFEAPWKVITLLLIILAACRILPKPAIKWFWLSVGVVVIGLIIWVFLPENTEGWKQYKYNFDKEIAAIEATRAIADEENAATIYNQLLANYDANALEPIFDPNYYDLIISTPWSSQDYPELAKRLKGQQGTIAKLFEASKIEKCRFPIPADTVSLEKSMERLAPMRHWAYLLIYAGNKDLGEGRVDEGLKKYVVVLEMAKHQYQQPTGSDVLIGIAIEALVTKQFDRFVIVGDATEAHLSVIEKAIAEIKHDWGYDLPRILEGEKLLTKNEFAKFYEVNPEGKIRLSRDPLAQMRTHCQQRLQDEEIEEEWLMDFLESVAYPSYLEKKLIKADTIFKWFYVSSDPQRATKIIDAAYEKFYAMAKPDFDWKKEPKEVPITINPLVSMRLRFNQQQTIEYLAGMSEKLYYGIHDIYLRITSDKRGSQIIIALRRYKNENGQWPESLDDIKSLAPAEIFVDPINGNSFVYKLTEENFTLHSKGKNSIDEGGKRDKWDEEKTWADDWLIWSPSNSKAKEESKTDKKAKDEQKQ